jgi:hypothetical protein
MDFEVYCDESHQDLMAQKKTNQYIMIGSLWLDASIRNSIKCKIVELRKKYNVWGEIKWSKISPSKKDFYLELIGLFISYNEKLRFRCIAIESSKVNLGWHNHDKELGFYKFYYQLLHHWIKDLNTYTIFCDAKTNREPTRLKVLSECISASNLTAKIKFVQALPSHEVVLLQLTDLLLGAASARLNCSTKSTAKLEVIASLEHGLGHQLASTFLSEDKFNIFKIQLEGGW